MNRLSLSLLAAVALAIQAKAQDYPSRPITMIVPFAAGGTSDVIARLIAEELGKQLGQRVVNENIAGAGGSTALTRLAREKPDGYTIAIGNSGTNAAAYSIYPDLKYTSENFVSAGMVAKTSPMIALRKDFPAATVAEFIDLAKKTPGKYTLGHAGVGSSNYLICKNFMAAAGIDTLLVSYRGAAPALNDLMGGQIDGVCDAATSVGSAIGAGTVKGLVVGTPERIAILPDVPTAAEAGLPAFQAQGWNALFLPKGASDDVIKRLNTALRAALTSPELKKRFPELASFIPSPQEQEPGYVTSILPAEIEKYRKLMAEK